MDATSDHGANGTNLTSTATIRLDSVSKVYSDGTTAVRELSLEVNEGEIAVFVGPSGCGKTTTMRMINRLVDPTSGTVYVEGQDVAQLDPVALRRRIGYVIQQVGLFPHQSVRRNVGTVCSLLGWDRRRTRARVDELLEIVGLNPATYGDRYPHQLSGGQRQRVGVARALAADPPVLLMDEPFGAVDPIARERLQSEFLTLQRTLKPTVVFVTHDLDEAVRLGDRIAVLSEGGVLEQYATPSTVLASPATAFVANFVGRDRTLKRLAVTALDGAELSAFDGGRDESATTVTADINLREALVAVLDSPTARVRVTESDGTVRGVLTLDSVYRRLREVEA